MSKTVMMFPGQASQYVGMGKDWFSRYEQVKRRFGEASDILGMEITKMCFEGPSNDLTKTENAQVALVTLSVAMYEVVSKEMGIVPNYLAGHSIGEISALTASGVFSFENAIKLARARGEAMAACCSGKDYGMAAVVKMNVDQLEALLLEIELDKYSVEIANYNSPSQTILSGRLDDLKNIGGVLKLHQADLVMLNVSGAFHSKYMAPAKDKLSEVLANLPVKHMEIPVFCGHKGRLYSDNDDLKMELVEQLVAPVRWTKVITELKKLGTDKWFEIGPKQVLKSFVLKTIPNESVFSYDEEEPQKAEAGREEVKDLNLVGLCLGAAVSTKNSNWDEEEYKMGVIQPYKEIQNLFRKTQEEKRQATEEELGQCLSLLEKIFKTKGISDGECAVRYRKILKNSGHEEKFSFYM